MLTPRRHDEPHAQPAVAAARACGVLALSAACAACGIVSGLDEFELAGAAAGSGGAGSASSSQGTGGGAGTGGAGGAVGCVPPGPWSVIAGDAAEQRSLAVAADSAGNTVITGSFSGTMDLGGGPLTSVGNTDLFVAKFDGCGNHLWSRSFGNNNDQTGRAIAMDRDGNVVVAGEFIGDLTLDSVTLVNANKRDLLVFKLDSDGAVLWAQNISGGSDCYGYGVAVDGNNDILVAGSVDGTIQIGGQDVQGGGSDDVFLLKLDPAGNHIWSRRAGNGSSQRAYSVATTAAGDVVITGEFTNTIDFGGGSHTSAGYDSTNGGNPDLFVAAYSAAGDYLCDLVAGDGSTQRGIAIAVAPDGAAVVTGELSGKATFGSTELQDTGGRDIFLVKVPVGASCNPDSTSFTPLLFGGSGDQLATGLAAAPDGVLWLTGQFKNSVDFGGGPLANNGDFDFFIAALDAAGGHRWSLSGGQANPQTGASIAAGPGGAALVTGFFQGTIDLPDQSPTSAGNNDLFLTRVAP